MAKECQLRKKIKTILKTKFPNSLMLPLSDKYHKGYPDLIILFNGQVYFIELKTPKGKLSKLQKYYINNIYNTSIIISFSHETIT